ncbi:phage tail protein [Enterobacter sp. 725m/11]|uniref:phage tail protein n=1 Tax=Enterobacter sp. 725m/11 TaxID=2717853 RepID=UPI0014198ED7|nr:phage tail protein [Enterobacter sp. 725m/11]NIB50689.1 phage tail protein [Enterobacter sp. 725m/11]
MSAKFYTLLTDIGAAKLASAAALGVPLKITQMAVGDGGGVLPTPSAQQTKLVAEKRRAALNMLYIDPQNSSQIIAEQVIPETEGGWWIREVGLFDETGALIAVGNCPESYKPQLAEGSGRTQTVRMVLITSSTDNITLKIDPSVVLATRKYVDDKVLELKVYVDDLMEKHLEANDPHPKYAKKESPEFTGIPLVPDTHNGNYGKQIANTKFVHDVLTEALKEKQPLDSTLTNLSGKSVSDLLQYLGLGDGSALPVGVPVPWSSATPPTGWLKCNGAAFTAAQYPKLAQAYPTLVLPDLRGVFVRGWDDGRNLDTGRGLLSYAGDKLRKHTHSLLFGNGDGAQTPAVHESYRKSASQVYFAVAGSSGAYISEEGDNETAPCNIAFNYIVRAA